MVLWLTNEEKKKAKLESPPSILIKACPFQMVKPNYPEAKFDSLDKKNLG